VHAINTLIIFVLASFSCKIDTKFTWNKIKTIKLIKTSNIFLPHIVWFCRFSLYSQLFIKFLLLIVF